MTKRGKITILGLTSVGVVAAAVATVVKKVKEVDDWTLPEDYSPNTPDDDDLGDEDDFDDETDFEDEDGFEDEFDLEDEEFDLEDDFDSIEEDEVAEETDYCMKTLGVSYEEAKAFILSHGLSPVTSEELDDLDESDVVDLYIECKKNDEQIEGQETLDTFKLINEHTREEVADILVNADSIKYEKETLLSLSDGELTQIYADFKVGSDKF